MRFLRNTGRALASVAHNVQFLLLKTPSCTYVLNKVSLFTRAQINIQLGSLTVNTSRLEALDDRIVNMEDFKEVFGKDLVQVQCAPVKISSMRLWYAGPFVLYVVLLAIGNSN